jgi:hypothetical protein
LPKLCFVADGSAGRIRSAQVILSLRHFSHYLIISSERNARGLVLSKERRFFRYCANVSNQRKISK